MKYIIYEENICNYESSLITLVMAGCSTLTNKQDYVDYIFGSP